MIRDNIMDNQAVKPNSRELKLLRKDFPQFFNIDGEFLLEQFKDMLGETNVSLNKEGYELKFLGKSYARYLSASKTETFIAPVLKHNSLPENKNSENIYIVGDNIDALKHLLSSYMGRIKCIYIDPPYNTGSDDFAYPDNFSFSVEQLVAVLGIDEDEAKRTLDLAGKSSHSAWLTFMYPRLTLARNLLSEDGVIFISIDDNEQANLKMICDEILGEESFVTTIHCQLSTTQGMKVQAAQNGNIVKNGEYILCYSKNGHKNIVKNLIYDYREKYDNHYTLLLKDDGTIGNILDLYNYKFPSDLNNKKPLSIEEAYRKSNEFAEIVRSHLAEIVRSDKIGDIDVTKLEHGVWTKVNHKGKEYILTLNNKGNVQQLLRLSDSWGKADDYYENEGLRKIRGDWWPEFYLDMGNVNKEGDIEFKNGKKPVRLIYQLIKMVTNSNDIILDFFSGSATTAHATMKLNSNDGGRRQYILVQLPEIIKEKQAAYKRGYRTIDEIGRKRIINAAMQIKEDSNSNIDYGFKLYKLVEVENELLDKLEKFDPDLLLQDNMVDIFKTPYSDGKNSILTTYLNLDGYGLTCSTLPYQLHTYSADKINDSLYIIEEGLTSEDILSLIKKIECRELNINRVVLYSYSIEFSVLQELRKNLSNLQNNKHVELIERY